MIDALELKMYRSAVVNDGSTNGGRMGNAEVIDGAGANLFPTTSQSERTAGSIKYRKFFPKVANDADEVGANPKIFFTRYTLGPDLHTFFPGTQVDTQATITGSEAQYGVGKLNANVSAAATSIAVLVEQAATIIFRSGSKIRISDKLTADASGGNEEFVTISGTPSLSGNVATITLATALQNGYSASDTYVSTVYEPADIKPLIDNFVVATAGSGDYDPDLLTGDSIGGIYQTWTATFTSATAFGVSGDTVGSVGTGSISAGITPNNGAFSKPYFVLAPGGFSGTWAAADTIVFRTYPAAVGIWAKRNVPASSAAYSPNFSKIALRVESA